MFGYPLMEKKSATGTQGLICALKFPTMETQRMARYEAPSPAKKVGRQGPGWQGASGGSPMSSQD